MGFEKGNATRKPRKRLGQRLVEGAKQLRDTLANGERIESRFTVRTVQLDLEPEEYDANDVRRIRQMLGVSQALFAQVLMVSPKLVQAWEQGTHKPTGPARRLLEEIESHPSDWIRRIKQAATAKGGAVTA